MPIGRLFFEIAGDTSRLNASLREAIKTAEDAGVKITRAGQSFISKFDEALNPTSARCLGTTRSTLQESITPGSVPTQHQRTFFACWKGGN
jgi:hypothetical protein